MIVGLTGGIGSGKSTVASILREQGVPVIDADDLARSALAADSPLLMQVTDALGKEILDTSGNLNRARLREEIFSSPDKRAALDAIIHPWIARQRTAALNELCQIYPIVVYDAALLIENGLHHQMDAVILVACSSSTQLRRIVQRDGVSPEQAQRAIQSQMSLPERLPFAHYVIENNRDDMEDLRQQVICVLVELEKGSRPSAQNSTITP